MTSAEKKLHAQAEKLRDQLAKAQAIVDDLAARLRKVEGKISSDPSPETGLEILWKEAPRMARTRSSKFKCRAAWNRIPPTQRPRVVEVIAALKAWSRCSEWKKDDGQFVPALDRWIKERRWESLPEESNSDVAARYRVASKPARFTAPEDVATPEDIAEIFKALSPKSRRMNS